MVRIDKRQFPDSDDVPSGLSSNGWVYISRAWLPKTRNASQTLCDDGETSNVKRSDRAGWPPVCSHKQGGYRVPGTPMITD